MFPKAIAIERLKINRQPTWAINFARAGNHECLVQGERYALT